MASSAPVVPNIAPCLWFDGKALEAAEYYVSIFANSSITNTQYYTKAGEEFHKRTPKDVLAVSFKINNQPWTALNGASEHAQEFTNAVSFQINCANQDEIDYFWGKLDGGDDSFKQCGWIKDRFGLMWQVVPEMFPKLLSSVDGEAKERTMKKMFQMKKLIIKDLEDAAKGV